MNRDKKKKVILLSVIFVLVLVALVVFMLNLDNIIKDDIDQSTTDSITDMQTVYIDGEGYLRKDYIKTYLIIGLDKDGELDYSELSYNELNQADFILLFVVDEQNQKCNLLHINRDTMTDVDILGKFGDVTDTQKLQICLAHAYGGGMQKSCENTVNAVSNLLYGAKIDRYISASMSAVAMVNDFIGGVTVDIEEDLTAIDPSMTEGSRVTLYGDNALMFIRARRGVGDQTNISRMKRQRQYLSAFAQAFRSCGKSRSEFNTLLDDCSKYLISDCGVDDYNKIFEAGKTYTIEPVITPDGEATINEGHVEFYANEDSLKEIVKSVFYDKVEK